MRHHTSEATPPPAVRTAAAILMSWHGVAALAHAARSANRAL